MRDLGAAQSGWSPENSPTKEDLIIGDSYYLDRALAPYAEPRRGTVRDLLTRELAVMLMADVGALTGDETLLLTEWLDQGGILVRFAGPAPSRR